jgi:hypothetical protein
LKHEEEDMWCVPCKEYWCEKESSLHSSAKAWLKGTSNFTLDTIKYHEESKMHKDAVKAASNAMNIKQSEATTQRVSYSIFKVLSQIN